MIRTSWNFIVLASIVFATFAQSISAANWTGGGGQGMSITIWAPQARNLAENQDYLPLVVQGEFLSNFTKFSAIEVFDRERLDERYAQILSSAPNERVREEMIAELERERTHILRGDITRTTTGYNLQMRITRTADGATAAAYSGTFTFAELDDLTGIRRASLDLIQRMGVVLTANAQQELAGAAPANHIGAQTHNARAVVAQRQGRETEAMANFNMAAILDPSLTEASNRLSVLEASIRSGNIGDNLRGEIAWRRAWVERLTETEQFLADFHRREAMPYTLFYGVEITQGAINWQTETINLSIETHLHGSCIWTRSIEQALQVVSLGLLATGRAQDWGLANWPRQSVTNLNAFGRRSSNFQVVFELLNDQNRVIGRQTLQTGGSWEFSWNRSLPSISVNASNRQTLNFPNVSAHDISDKMSIRVATVNGMSAENAARDGVLQIRVINSEMFARNSSFKFSKGQIQGFARRDNRPTNLVIPDNIWGDPVTSIGARAFEGNQLTGVRIPPSITVIYEAAFNNNRLSSVSIPGSVLSIWKSAFSNNQLASVSFSEGTLHILDSAFANNRLTRVIIPNSVRTIGEKAFGNNLQHNTRITNITIGANVGLAANSFGNEFTRTMTDGSTRTLFDNSFAVFYYNTEGRKAGEYRHVNYRWRYGISTAEEERIKKRSNVGAWFMLIGGIAALVGIFVLLDNIGAFDNAGE